jgi:hypothetical protein
MSLAHDKTVSILDVLAQKGECELDELVLFCDGLGWHQVFLEIDRLSREGQVRLIAKGCGIYVVSLTTFAKVDLQQSEPALR